MLDPESVEGDDGAVFLRNSCEFSQNSLELITIHGFLFDQQFHQAIHGFAVGSHDLHGSS